MSTEELAGLLDRNVKDLADNGLLEGMMEGVNASLAAQQRGGGRSVSGTLPRRILSLISTIVMAVAKTTAGQIARHPRQSTLLAMMLVLTLLTTHNIPKNGLVISTPFSRGHTTFLQPPVSYMEQYYADRSSRWESSLPEPIEIKSKQSKAKKEIVGGVGMTRSLALDTSQAQVDEVTVQTHRDQEGFALVTSAFQMIPTDDMAGSKEIGEEKDGLELQETMEYMLESISALFDERKFSEFAPDKIALKWKSFLVTDEEDEDGLEGAVMSMRLLGDFGRFGIQPFCFSYDFDEEDMDDDSTMIRCVAFHTLKGGHFDGEVKFTIDATEDGPGIILGVTLAIPSGGRTPPIRLAESMVSTLTTSILRSSQLRIKQSASRRNQSKLYRSRAHGRAAEKRHLRYEQEKNQEEMAAERKRRWKRNNPDAGHYRPSGHRLRSPGGSPNF
jgi:hypothetical protein